MKKPATSILLLCAWGYSDARQVEPDGIVLSGDSSSTLLAIMGRPITGIVNEGDNATVSVSGNTSGKAVAVQFSGDATIDKNNELSLKKNFVIKTKKTAMSLKTLILNI